MQAWLRSLLSPPRVWLVLGALCAVIVGGWWLLQPRGPSVEVSERAARQGRAPVQPTKVEVELTENQAAAFRVATIGRADFELVRQAVGNIDFNQNMLVQVFTPYQGRIISIFAKVGDRVQRGQLLFTVDSPDLLQAENTLISAAGVAVLQARTLKRVTENLRSGGGAQKDVDQATSDQQAAEGAVRTSRDAVRIFGKTDEEIDQIIANRRADPVLVVRSPVTGVVTQSIGAPGLFIQPGNAPPPFTVADTSTMWMVANVVETDSAALRVGQPVQVQVAAFPGQSFDGAVSVVGASIDMQTRRLMVRSEIKDPDGLLRAGMFATFTIKVGDTRDAVAVPDAAVVREGDGTMTLWVTTDRRHFEKRTVKIGLRQKGFTQILEGAAPGELIATEGAVFLSNKLVAGPAG
jgi:membrane fusion protein, heavy metal efflux system